MSPQNTLQAVVIVSFVPFSPFQTNISAEKKRKAFRREKYSTEKFETTQSLIKFCKHKSTFFLSCRSRSGSKEFFYCFLYLTAHLCRNKNLYWYTLRSSEHTDFPIIPPARLPRSTEEIKFNAAIKCLDSITISVSCCLLVLKWFHEHDATVAYSNKLYLLANDDRMKI